MPTLTATPTFRLLPPEEWTRLVETGMEPFVSFGLPDPEHWRLIVAEVEGRIIGLSGLYNSVHNDPWWIAPEARHSPTVVRGLWRETKKVLDEAGVSFIYATVADQQPEVQAMVQRLGYVPAPGKLFLLNVADCALNDKEKE